LKEKEILFVKEPSRAKSINLGVIAIRNSVKTRELFSRLTEYIHRGYWDQGVMCCMLNRPTRHDCTHISNFKIRWGYLPDRFAQVKKLRHSSSCVPLKTKNLPIIVKFTISKDEVQYKRMQCLRNYMKYYSP